MHPPFQDLLQRLDHLSDQCGELKDGVQKAIRIADEDPEMALTRARKVLEYVVREVYERRIQEPPGTRPLENLLQRLVKDGYFPDRLDAYANTIRKLGNVGTHTFGEKITVADVVQSLAQLMPILEWYFETERPTVVGERPAQLTEKATAKPGETGSGARPEATIAIVPKGLRSFDAQDADFFLDLLPGARDKNGLPESIRFWKHRIEAGDELAFTVGVIYGPSGCGKSSLVKAGLLPRLAKQVFSVYVEATAADTEARLIKLLRKRCPRLPDNLDLTGTIAALRQGQELGEGQKVFIVIDQFEQWLHARRGEENTELAQALRQCDGVHVQCVVMVRDDFWVALSRFMGNLDIELVPSQNAALVDLFDLIHARHVLIAFGRAFGRLGQTPSKEQEAFLDQAVQGLAQDGRVISVRLALFAEMMKGKPWTTTALRGVGGTAGVGVTFLEETFSSSMANPKARMHQQAARSILNALLPDQGTDIKGNMQSHARLLEASGYASRPKEFEELIRILDSDIRLITPTDPKEKDGSEESQAEAGQKYYQLTHDYLVHSIRDWLTRKQKETRRGRAELLLADRAGVWAARPEHRQLPSLLQWVNIRLLTERKTWTGPQRTMMRRAGRYHAVRGLVVVALLALVGWGVYEGHGNLKAHALRARVLDADTSEAPAIVREMGPYRRWLDPLLENAFQEAEAKQEPRKQLHASLALLPVEPRQKDYLYDRLLDAAPQEVSVLRDALAPYKAELLEKLWSIAEQPGSKENQRLRAAGVLATYAAQDPRWNLIRGPVVAQLVSENPVYLGLWIEAFRPVQGKLLDPLKKIYRDADRRESERTLATSILADYAADQPALLADLVMDADEKQYAVLYPKLKAHEEPGLIFLQNELDKQLPADAEDDAKEKLAKRQANAAVTLLKMDWPDKVWPMFKHSTDPRRRSYLIHQIGPLHADPGVILTRLKQEPDVTIRRALILSLGAYGEKEWTAAERADILETMRETYRTAADPGLHGSAEWLLRQLKQEPWLIQLNDKWAKDNGKRRKRLAEIGQEFGKTKQPALAKEAAPQWYVNGQGQTMIVIPGSVEFTMGSPPSELGRFYPETQHLKRIDRTFAIAAKPVTVEEYQRFDKGSTFTKRFAPTSDCPVISMSWLDAAAYCNWLSDKEGIPPAQWCYDTDAKGKVTKMKDKYLHVTGYRLPTGAELEYATRAGAGTCRYFGETDELLPMYAWYVANSKDHAWPVGSKKPNDFGMFDALGNIWNWCQERYTRSEPRLDDNEEPLDIDVKENRVVRAGSFVVRPWNLRSANFDWQVPTYKTIFYGFRVAKTFAVE